MSIRRRLKQLEAKFQIVGQCPGCGGKGGVTVVYVNPGEKPPRGGCPTCGKGHCIAICIPSSAAASTARPPSVGMLPNRKGEGHGQSTVTKRV